MNRNSFLYTVIFSLLVSLVSCQDDDVDTPTPQGRDLQTQANLDDRKIQTFLTNYTFNDLDFEIVSGVDNVKNNGFTHENIEFIRIKDAEGNDLPLSDEDKMKSSGTALINSPFLKSISNIQANNINYTAYYLQIREGEGKPITIIDPVYSAFNGSFLGDTAEIFEEDTNNLNGTFIQQNRPVWTSLINGNVGFSRIVSKFKTLIPIQKDELLDIADRNQLLVKQCQVFEEDGSQSSNSYGIGAAFIPSGIGFGDLTITNPNGSNVMPYQNLIYTFTLFNTDYLDEDNDGIPSLLEMTDAEGNINPNLDTDNDGLPDYNDIDDDNDERLTVLEIEITDSSGEIDSDCDGIFGNDRDVEFQDANNNGVPDHLDNTIRFGF